MYGFEGMRLSEVQLSISELSVVGGGGGLDKRTSWSDLHRVRQKKCKMGHPNTHILPETSTGLKGSSFVKGGPFIQMNIPRNE